MRMLKRLCGVCALALAVTANSNEKLPHRPLKMTFSYVEHPTMLNYIIPIIRDSYQKLGIKTDFVAQPSNRNLLLVDKNIVDGDVGYMRIVLGEYQHIITVEPPLVSGIFTLLCQPNILCDASVLADSRQTVVATSVSKNGMEQGYKGVLKSQFYTVNDLAVIPSFITSGRFSYAIYPSSETELQRLDSATLRYVKLFDANLYHVLNEKYAYMADDISQALRQTLQERRQQASP